MSNPIVIKELIQGAHRRRLYLLRAALPAVAILIVAPRVALELTTGPQSWRAVSGIARPIFQTCSWMQLVVFSLLAAGLSGSCLGIEWQRKTIELLCATPISFAGIVYGKFTSVLGKIFLIGLALLPVQAVYVYVGRIAAVTVFRSLGVVAGATVLFGGLSLLQGAVFTKRVRWGGLRVEAALLYALTAVALCGFLWDRVPALAALVPFWSFSFCLSGTAPGGMSPADFAALAIAVPLGIGMLAVGATPAVFRASFMRHIGAAGSARQGWFARPTVRRPRMKANEHPFAWQERGRGTRLMRWSVPLAYACVTLCAVIMSFLKRGPGLRLVEDIQFYIVLLSIGLGVMAVQSVFFCAQVFAREKLGRTAQALVLTGVPSRTFLREKIRAMVLAQRGALAATAAVLVAGFVVTGLVERWRLGGSEYWIVAVIAVCAPVLILGSCIPVMVLSAAARTPAQTIGALLLSLLLQAGSCLTLVIGGIILTVGAAQKQPWTVWRLAVLLAITSIGLRFPLTPLVFLGGPVTAAASVVLVGLHGFLWYHLGVVFFEKCMAGDE